METSRTSTAQAVLLVHGWMASSHVWDPLAALLGAHRIVAPDLFGCGQGCEAALGLDAAALTRRLALTSLAADVLAVADGLGLSRFHLVGHSMGGQIAQLLAARAPSRVQSLALLCPVPLSGMSLPPEADALFRAAGGDAAKLGTVLDLACKALTDHDRSALVREALRIAPHVIATGLDVWTRGEDSALSAISAPTLVLATDDPFLTPAFLEERVVARIARAELRVMPGPGHYPQVEAPADTARVLTEFWGRHT